MRSTLIRVTAIFAALFFVLAGRADAQEGARIHLIHGIPDTPVDVLVGGEAVFEGFQPGDTQDLSALAGETLTGLQVVLAGTDTVAIDAGDTALPATGNYSIIAHLDADGSPTLAVFENDTSAIAAGQGRVTVRHTAAAPAVDVLANGTAAFEDLENPDEVSADLPVGTVSAAVAAAGTTDPVIGPVDITIADGTSLIVYAVGSLEDESLTVLTESITGLGTAPTAVNTGNSPVSDGSTSPLPVMAIVALGALALAVPARRLVAATVTR